MYNNLLVEPKAKRTRRVAHALVDQQLCFITNNPIIHRWTGLNGKSLRSQALIHVFPELSKMEETLQRLFEHPDEAVTLSALFRPLPDGRSRYFDLQIEPAPHLDSALMLLLIDVTQQTQMQQYGGPVEDDGLTAEQRATLTFLEKHNQDLILLNQASGALTATLATPEVLERLLQVATDLIGTHDSTVWLWEEDSDEWLTCRAASDKSLTPPLMGQRLKKGQGIVGWVAENGQSAVVTNTGQDKRFSSHIDAQSGFTTTSMMAVPLQIQNKTIGVLVTVNKKEGIFDTHDVTVAETLAGSASIAIDNARLVEELQAQAQDLQARNEDLDAFAHTVAHDLKNPLTVLMGFASLLQRDDIALPNTERKRILEAFSKNVYKINNIIQELLLLSSVRRQEVNLQPLPMQQIIGSAMARLSHMIDESHAEIKLPNRWPVAYGHAPWVEEVWENYLSNALKYGGNPPKIEVGGAMQTDGSVRFWIRDNGNGLTPDEQSRLFTPFTEISQVYKAGHGLGLSIVQRIIQKLGGHVDVESEPGKGSTFGFTLSGVDV